MAVRKTEKTESSRKTPAKTGDSKNGLKKIGALWLGTGKTGTKFMSGRIEFDDETEIRLLVFKNGYKEQSKHPDYIIYEPSEEQNAGRSTPKDDDDIPF